MKGRLAETWLGNAIGPVLSVLWLLLVAPSVTADTRAMIAQTYLKNYNASLLQDFNTKLDPWYRPNWIFGKDLEKTLKIYAHGGLSLAEQFYYAMQGWGTDDNTVRGALDQLRQMTRSEIDAVDQEYRILSNNETLRQGLSGDLSGRDWVNAQQALLGRPTSLNEEVRQLLEMVSFDRWDGTGVTPGDLINIGYGALQSRISSNGENLDRTRAELIRRLNAYSAGEVTEAQVRQQMDIVRQDLGIYTDVRDSTADFFANALATAATVGVVVFSGGTASPLLVAAIGAGAQTMGRFAIAGNSYQVDSMGADAINGALAGLTANISFFGTSQSASLLNYVMRGAAQGMVDGGATGFLLGAVEAAMRSSTWDQGFQIGLVQIAQNGAMNAIVGAVMGGAIGAVQRLLYCFPAGTPVSTESGLVAIEELSAGSKVWTFNFRAGQWELQAVLHRFEHVYTGDMATLQIGTDTLESTGNHPFWVLEGDFLLDRPRPEHIPAAEPGNRSLAGRWVDARDLRVGDLIVRRGNSPARVNAKTVRYESRTVYNLHVAENPNFLVGEGEVLVHNRLPLNGSDGHWVSGERGNGVWRSTHPDVIAACAPGASYVDITFRGGYPDFTPFRKTINGTIGEVTITLDTTRTISRSARSRLDFDAADAAMATVLNRSGNNPATGLPWTGSDVARFRTDNGLSWHHQETVGVMQLVSTDLNLRIPHSGGRSILDLQLGLPYEV